jgi:hypothetical protein
MVVTGEERRGSVGERRGEVEREEEGFTQLLSGDWLRWSSTVGRPRGG